MYSQAVYAVYVAHLLLQNIYYARQYHWILENISCELFPGQLLLVTGKNGSGKTSLLRIICGLTEAEKGRVEWQGKTIQSLKALYYKSICYVGHKDGIKDDLSITENIDMMCALYQSECTQDTVDNYMKIMALPDSDAMVATLSAGQRRRLALLRCLIAKRTLWILDEPFTALDKQGVELFQHHLSQHLDGGGMVIMASHQAIELPDNNIIELNLGE